MTRKILALALIAVSVMPTALVAAEFIMVEQVGCAWCLRFHREIGPAYPKTAEGAKAPLKLIDLHQPIPEHLAHLDIPKFTPVFILVDDEFKEVDRMVGYPGDDWFWVRLNTMLDKL